MAKIQRTLYRGNANQILVHYPNLSISICRVLILYCRVQDVNFDELMGEVKNYIGGAQDPEHVEKRMSTHLCNLAFPTPV